MPNHIRFEETETHFKMWIGEHLTFNVVKRALDIYHFGSFSKLSPFKKFLVGVQEVSPVYLMDWLEQLYEEGKLTDEPETI